jgi:hypothetical protein
MCCRPLLTVAGNHKLQLLVAASDLGRLPVPSRLVQWVEQEFNQLTNAIQELLKVASVYDQPFSAAIMVRITVTP